MKATIPIALVLMGLAAPLAGFGDASAQTSERIRRLIVYGNDPCPRGADGEIVVCARRPETERYRVPEEFRDDGTADDPESQSWAVRAQSIEYVGRSGVQSCSTVGPGGFTGCFEQMLRAARNERRANSENAPER